MEKEVHALMVRMIVLPVSSLNAIFVQWSTIDKQIYPVPELFIVKLFMDSLWQERDND